MEVALKPTKEIISEAKKLIDQQAFDAALDLLKPQLEQRPDNVRFHLLMARAATQAGELDLSTHSLNMAKSLGANSSQISKLSILLAIKKRAWHEVLELSESILTPEKQPGKAIFLGILQAFHALGLPDAEEAFTKTAADLYPQNTMYRAAYYQAICAHHAVTDLPALFERDIFDGEGRPENIIALMVYARDNGAFPERLIQLLQRAIAKWPDDQNVLLVWSNIRSSGLLLDDMPHVSVSTLDPQVAIPKLMQAYRPQLCLKPKLMTDESMQNLEKVLLQTFDTQSFKRPLVEDVTDSPHMISPVGSSGKTVLVFGGLRGRFGFPVGLLDMFFAARDVTAIYLKDTHRNLYLTGVDGLGATYFEFVESLKGMLDQIAGHQRLFSLGASGGGLGALNTAADLNVEAILLYSAATNASAEFLSKSGDVRARALQKRLTSIDPPQLLEPKARLRESGHSPKVQSCFSKEIEIDRLHSEDLRDLPNATITELVECETHPPFTELIVDQKYGAHLDWLIT